VKPLLGLVLLITSLKISGDEGWIAWVVGFALVFL